MDAMKTDWCQDQDMGALDTVQPGKIMAPLGLAMTLATGQNRHQSVTAYFHRGSPGIQRVARTFGHTDTKARRNAIAPYDYLAICLTPFENTDLSAAPLFQALNQGEDWPGLKQIPNKTDSRFRLFKIDHGQLK